MVTQIFLSWDKENNGRLCKVIPNLLSLVICAVEAEKLTIFPACLELSVVKYHCSGKLDMIGSQLGDSGKACFLDKRAICGGYFQFSLHFSTSCLAGDVMSGVEAAIM